MLNSAMLGERHSSTKKSAATSQQDLDQALATLEGAQARKDLAQYNLDQTTIMARSNGILATIRVSAGNQARAMDPVMPFIRKDSLVLGGVFSQNGLGAMPIGTPVKVTFDRMPGQIFVSNVASIAPGTSSGQIEGGSTLLDALDFGSSSEAFALLSWPEDLDRTVVIAGSVGSAAVSGPDAGAIDVLATVLFYLKMILRIDCRATLSKRMKRDLAIGALDMAVAAVEGLHSSYGSGVAILFS